MRNEAPKPCRKLLVFPGNFPPHVGGLETHVDEFARFLGERGTYSITVVAPRLTQDARATELRWRNVQVYRYPAFELIPNYPVPKFWTPTFWNLLWKLKGEPWDVVMTRTRFFTNTLLGVAFAKLRRIPIRLIHVEHGSAFVATPSRITTALAWTFDMTFGKGVMCCADRVVAISSSVQGFIADRFRTRAPVPTIRRGIDIDHIDRCPPDPTIEMRFPDKLRFLYAGRFYAWKSVDRLIQAFRRLEAAQRERAVLLLVGYGQEEPRLRELAHGDSCIVFLGKQPFEATWSIMKACNFYVHPSSPGGGLSSALLQAIYCGCTAIASPHEGGREALEETAGVLLPDNDVATLCAAIATAITQGPNQEHASPTKTSFRQRFAWRGAIAAYEAILDEMLDPSGSPHSGARGPWVGGPDAAPAQESTRHGKDPAD